MAKNTYVSGQFNLYCDSCGKKIKAGEAKKRWDGLIVCPDDYEERQPQDFVKAKLDRITVPFARPSDPWKFSIPLGMFDRVLLDEEAIIISVQASKNFADIVPVSDVFNIYRAAYANEVVPISETFEADVQFALNIDVDQDRVILGESGKICRLNYVDHTYFAQVYVADNCTDFPANILADTVGLSDTGFITPAPYVEASYFAQDYVGVVVHFNP